MAPTTTSRSRPYYSRRCKLVRSTSTYIDSLSDDLLSEILVRVPADDLHERARLVCRRWSHLISSPTFANTHLHRSSYGLVLAARGSNHPVYVSATKQGQIEVSRLSWDCVARGSCNGLVADFKPLRILNPATKKAFILPAIGRRWLQFCGIAYCATSMEYKAVQVHHARHRTPPLSPAILTVGVDNSWRQLQDEHIPANLRLLMCVDPAVTEGFFHWGARDSGELLTLNVETEILTVTRVPLPAPARAYIDYFRYLSAGTHLSLLVRGRNRMWEVWEMKPGTGEWKKCLHFQFASEQIDIDHSWFAIHGWVKYPEVLACSVSADTLICYNLHTHEIHSTDLPGLVLGYNVFMHKNTLVWLR